MINDIKNLSMFLAEEIKYYDNALFYSKSLEATLWGFEQQAQYPENSSKTDQDDLSEEINRVRIKLMSIQKLITDQESKIFSVIKNFSSKSSCGGCEE